MTLFLLILSGVINLVLLYVVFNLFKKLGTYEQWVISFGYSITKLYFDIKQVDSMNLFEKDDHVGFVFGRIVSLIEEFNKRMGNSNEDDEKEA